MQEQTFALGDLGTRVVTTIFVIWLFLPFIYATYYVLLIIIVDVPVLAFLLYYLWQVAFLKVRMTSEAIIVPTAIPFKTRVIPWSSILRIAPGWKLAQYEIVTENVNNCFKFSVACLAEPESFLAAIHSHGIRIENRRILVDYITRMTQLEPQNDQHAIQMDGPSLLTEPTIKTIPTRSVASRVTCACIGLVLCGGFIAWVVTAVIRMPSPDEWWLLFYFGFACFLFGLAALGELIHTTKITSDAIQLPGRHIAWDDISYCRLSKTSQDYSLVFVSEGKWLSRMYSNLDTTWSVVLKEVTAHNIPILTEIEKPIVQ